jgi:hypothetical protein
MLACTVAHIVPLSFGRHKWEQEKLEASLSCRLAPACSRHERWRTVHGKMLENAVESPASSARCWVVVLWMSRRYMHLANSRLKPIEFYAQQINFMKLHNTLRATQNLLHLPALRQLIQQLIQISNLPRQSILDFLHTISTDYSGDEVRIRV